MSQDIRVIIIKLADRLHNMRTLNYRPGVKQRKTAHETMNIYAPIAHRLGMRGIKEELEDRAFHYLDPFAYSEIEHILEIKKSEREAFITRIKKNMAERFNDREFSKQPQIDVYKRQGHNEETTLDFERKNNPYMNGNLYEDFI